MHRGRLQAGAWRGGRGEDERDAGGVSQRRGGRLLGGSWCTGGTAQCAEYGGSGKDTVRGHLVTGPILVPAEARTVILPKTESRPNPQC